MGNTKRMWIMNRFLSLVAAGLTAVSLSYAGPGYADGAAKFVGNITVNGQVRSDFGQYWNQITAENECKWQSIEGTRGQYNFTGCRNAYNWAKQNGGHFKFHALVWGSQYPSWLGSLSAADTKTAITNWFDAVKKEFPDLEMIDVVNEAIRGNGGGYHSPYNNTKIIEALGGDNGQYTFITTAFKMARERWPKAILIYNDYNTIQWDVQGGIDLINTIRKNGAPIDGYGLQAHDLMTNGGGDGGTGGGGYCMKYSDFKSTMEKIHKETNNFPIFISEYDIPSTDDGIQKQCFEEQVSYWMDDPYVAGITMWGYIYGSTWLSCHNKTVAGCSGLIKDGKARPALTWLKDYLSKNKGNNATGLPTGIVPDPEPQTPYRGTPAAIPGKIEAEDFDNPGVGYGTASYNVGTSGKGNSNYRSDVTPNLYVSGTGVVIGYNEKGNWYEYTVNVEKAGTYTIYAAVASANNTSSFKLSLGDKDLTEEIAVPQAASGEENYGDFYKVSADIDLPAGEQIIRLTVTGSWFDIDYINFVNKGEADPNPIIKGELPPCEQCGNNEGGEEGETPAIAQNLHMNMEVLQAYDVFDMQGAFMGRVRAYSADQAIDFVKSASDVKFAKGVYYVRNKDTKQMQAFTIAR